MTLSNRKPLRQQLFKDTQLGEQARDVQGALDTIPQTVQRKMDLTYTEPMTLGLRQKPDAIEAIRVVRLDGNQEVPVSCGGLAHFTWKPELGGAAIYSIDGMSTPVNGGKKYRFTFRITYPAA